MVESAIRILRRTCVQAFMFLSSASLPRKLAAQFFLQASVAVLILAVLVPPFENPDEFNHANRVDQISEGGLIATRYGGPGTSGGTVDSGINLIDSSIGTVRFHPERKVTRDMMLSANAVRWGNRVPTTFANTSIYAPFLYVPAVAGILAGKLAGLSITRTLIVSRAVSGLTCVFIGSIAIAFAGEAALFLQTVLSLPMSIFLFACVSQDGPMLVLSSLAVTLILMSGRDVRPLGPGTHLALLSLCLALVAIGRPAYTTFCMTPLLLTSFTWRNRILAAAAAVSAVAAWSFLAAHWTMINAVAFRGVNPQAQLKLLVLHPALLWQLAVSVVTGAQGMEGSSFYRETVGILGWQDVTLPDFFYVVAGCALVGATIATLSRAEKPFPAITQGLVFSIAAGATILVFLLEYISWTPVGLPLVQGVQGRYFLPVLVFVPCMLPRVRNQLFTRLCSLIRVALLPFPAISITVMIVAVVHRYYL